MTCNCALCERLRPIGELEERLAEQDAEIVGDFINIYLHETMAKDDRIADLEHLIELARNFYPDIEEMPLYKELFG